MKKKRITGLLIANEWDPKGLITGMAIADFHESLIPIEPDPSIEAVIPEYLNKVVTVEGSIKDREIHGKTRNVFYVESIVSASSPEQDSGL